MTTADPPPAWRRAARLSPRHPSPRSGTGLLIDRCSRLHREDLASRFITTGASTSDGTIVLGATDPEAAIAALHAGQRRVG